MTTFRELEIGDTFDFINDDNHMMNSFYMPCKKISVRKYKYPTGKPKPFDFYVSRVGSIDVRVHHVGIAYPDPPLGPNA